LLLALHGLTQTGNIMMQFTNFNSYADQYGFIVVYPDGISNSWNVGFTGGARQMTSVFYLPWSTRCTLNMELT